MGYWGHLVLVHGDRPPSGFGIPEEVTELGDGWRVYRIEGETDLPAAVRTLAAQTDAPALAAYVLDSDCAALAAATPAGELWSTMLNPAVAEQLYGAPRPDPDADTRAALAWAGAAGLHPDEERVAGTLAGEATFAEDLFFDLLAALGVPAQRTNGRSSV